MLQSGKITFTGSQGHTLAAKMDRPDGEIRAYALFAHCFTCTKDIFAASRMANEMKKNGIAVLRFDFTGLGTSEGDFANTNFSSNVEDLIAAANFMRDNDAAPSILIGHSLGGSAVLAAAKDIIEVKAVVTIGAPADIAHVALNFSDSKQEIMEQGEAEICLVGRPFKIKRQFIEDLETVKLENNVRNLNKALLVLHAPQDETVSVENAAQIFKWAKHPKSYISLDDADHLITRRDDAIYIARMISCWVNKYI